MAGRKRNGLGLGSIHRWSSGNWVWQRSLGTHPHSGRHIRLTRERKTRAEAIAAGRLAMDLYWEAHDQSS